MEWRAKKRIFPRLHIGCTGGFWCKGTPKTLEFGVADETAWQVGLPCGGQIKVFVERLEKSEGLPLITRALDARTTSRLVKAVLRRGSSIPLMRPISCSIARCAISRLGGAMVVRGGLA